MEKCTTCGRSVDYPYCLDKFHDGPKPNPMLDALKDVQDRFGWGR